MGVYLCYGELLCLVDRLISYLNPTEKDMFTNDFEGAHATTRTNDQLSLFTDELNCKHLELTEKLQNFKASTLLER